MNIVFGKGFLGTRIAHEMSYEIAGREETDVLNPSSIGSYLDRKKPSIVINAVGKTGRPNIDWCEENKEETVQSNILAAANLCTESIKRGIYFVHLSSGCIYFGDKGGEGYNEVDEPNFYSSFYSRTKIIAEKILKEFPCLQLRIRMPVDDRPHDRNFIDKITKYPKVINVQNSMTTVPHMIDAAKKLIGKRATGIYNLVNPGAIGAAEIVQMYQKIVNPSHRFSIMTLNELDSITKARRSNCILNTDKLAREGINLPEIHQAIEECLLKYKDAK